MKYLFPLLIFLLPGIASAQALRFSYEGHLYTADEVHAKFVAKDFDFLEGMAAEFRKTKPKWEFNNRDRYLVKFYNTIDLPNRQTNEQEEAYLDTIKEWINAYPDSPTWKNLLIDYYADLAWDERGGGAGRDVSRDAFAGFRDYLIKGWTVVTNAIDNETYDSQIFVEALVVARGLEVDGLKANGEMFTQTMLDDYSRIRAASIGDYLFKKGVAMDAGNYDLYYYRAMNLTRRWGGEAGALESFFEEAAKVGDHEYNGTLYTQLFDSYMVWMTPPVFLGLYGEIDTDRIKKELPVLMEHDNGHFYWLNASAFYYGVMGEKDLANPLFKYIGKNYYSSFWRTSKRYNNWKAWSQGKENFVFNPQLESAIWFRNIDYLKHIIKNGADVNALNDYGYPPLYLATRYNHLKAADVLVDRGAELKNFDLIKLAVDESSSRTMNYLVRKGLDPNTVLKNGMPVTHVCARYGTPENMEILKNANAEMTNVWFKYGYSLLHTAVISRNPEMLNWLIDEGLDLKARNGKGETPLEFARRRQKIVEYESNIAKYQVMIDILEKAN